MTDDRQRPRTFLPDGIPATYRDFVRCRTNSLDIESGQVDWLPNMPPITLNFETGPNGSIVVKVLGAGGWVDLRIPLLIVDGVLLADTSSIPALADGVNEWVGDLNADLGANGMELCGASVVDGQLHVTKQQTTVVGDTTTTTAIPQPPMTIPPPPAHVVNPIPGREPVSVDESIPHPGQDFSGKELPAGQYALNRWSKWQLGGAATAGAFVLLVSAWFLFADDGKPDGPPAIATQTQDVSASGSDSDDTPPAGSEAPSGEDSEAGGDTGTESSDSDDSSDPDTEGFKETPSAALSNVGRSHGLERPFVMHRPDTVGDFNGCGPSSAPGADVLGVAAGQEGDRVTAVVWMAVPPTESDQQFSNALVLDVVQRSGSGRSLVYEVHNDQRRIGEQDASGNMMPGSDVEITIDDTAVVFVFDVDAADPLVLLNAQSFNMPTDGDAVGCDTAIVAARPFPAPESVDTGACIETETTACLSDNRFEVQVSDTDDTAMIRRSAENDGVGMGEGTTSGFVRVLNGCETNGHYWVFSDGFMDGDSSVWSTIRITDTETSETKTYTNSLDPLDTTIQDISAIAACP